MKKATCKLLVHRETLRALGVLKDKDLTRVIGGLAESADTCRAPQRESTRDCPAPVVASSDGTCPP